MEPQSRGFAKVGSSAPGYVDVFRSDYVDLSGRWNISSGLYEVGAVARPLRIRPTALPSRSSAAHHHRRAVIRPWMCGLERDRGPQPSGNPSRVKAAQNGDRGQPHHRDRIRPFPFELATQVDAATAARLTDAGWHLRDSREISRDVASHRTFIQSSRGGSRSPRTRTCGCGVARFSDRRACYLARDHARHRVRNVLTGKGLFAFGAWTTSRRRRTSSRATSRANAVARLGGARAHLSPRISAAGVGPRVEDIPAHAVRGSEAQSSLTVNTGDADGRTCQRRQHYAAVT